MYAQWLFVLVAIAGCGRFGFDAVTEELEEPEEPGPGPVVLGIESVVGAGDYRRTVTTRDVQQYFVRVEDEMASLDVSWFVTSGGDPTDADLVTNPISWGAFEAGTSAVFVDVSDGLAVTRAGPFEIDVQDFGGHVEVFGAADTQYSQSIAVDAFGAVYTSGYFYGSASLDPAGSQVATASTGIWLSKLDASGRFEYGATWEGQGQIAGLALDGAQHLYLAGIYTGQIDLDPGPGVALSADTSGRYGGFVLQLDRSGQYVWGRSWAGSDSFTIFDVRAAPDGAVYALGYLIGTGDLDPGPGVQMHTGSGDTNPGDGILVRLDRDGMLTWARGFGAGGDTYAYDLELAPDGTIVCSGSIGGTVDLDPGPGTDIKVIPSATAAGTFLASFDADGNYRWGHALGGETSFDLINEIAIANDGSIYVTGGFSSTSIDFDPGPGTAILTNQVPYDSFVAKYTAAGDFVWVKPIAGAGHDNGWGIVVDQASGDVIATGHFNGTIDLDPGPGVDMHTAPSASSATWVVRLGADGQARWGSSWGGTDSTGPSGVALGTYLYVAGDYSGLTDFDPGAGVSEQTAVGQEASINYLSAETGRY